MQSHVEHAALHEQVTTVVIADDHPLVRAGVRATLENEPEFLLLAEATNSREVLEKVRDHSPDLLILDLDLGDEDAPSLVKRCQEVCPTVKVLIFSSHTEPKYLRPLRNSGIDAFVSKCEHSDSFLQALRVVRSGMCWFSQTVLQAITAVGEDRTLHSLTKLTVREQQVLDLMLLGKDNQAIADELALSKQTVRRHATVIYEKLGVKGRVQAVVRAGSRTSS